MKLITSKEVDRTLWKSGKKEIAEGKTNNRKMGTHFYLYTKT